jgi:hypothetical protein
MGDKWQDTTHIKMSAADRLAYEQDKELYGNGFISVARGGNVGRRIAPQDVQIKMPKGK